MQLDARGLPLHTRSLSITLVHADPATLAFAAYVVDLRKRGFAPVGGDVQGTGIIHHMMLDGEIDVPSRIVRTIAARMPTVAFEPSATSGGETCRDVVGRPSALAGASLDGPWARTVGTAIGGPRGCSHVLTLAQLLVPTIRWALAQDERLYGRGVARREGERVFRRDVTVDGHELPSRDLHLVLQLADLHLAPAPAVAQPMDRFGEQRELRLHATARVPDLALLEIDAAERRRGLRDLADAAWEPRTGRVAPLVGTSLRAGITQAILARFADPGGDAPLVDALLQLAPTTVQCFAALDLWTRMLEGGKGAAGADTGGLPDSCYMWRREGVLGRTRHDTKGDHT